MRLLCWFGVHNFLTVSEWHDPDGRPFDRLVICDRCGHVANRKLS